MTLASNGNWTFIGANETIDSVCVYNIIPDQCSKCQDQAFCRYADLGFSYLLFLSTIWISDAVEYRTEARILYADKSRQQTVCVCPNSKTGDHCEINLCSHCKNGGSCQIKNDTNEIECICPAPFYGKYCESSECRIFLHFQLCHLFKSMQFYYWVTRTKDEQISRWQSMFLVSFHF